MALPRWVEWLVALATLVGVGGGLVGVAYVDALAPYRWHLIAAGLVFIGSGLVIPLVAGVFLPLRKRWLRYRIARARVAEQKKADAKMAADRERMRPILAALSTFNCAASEALGVLDELHYEGSVTAAPADLTEGIQRALSLASDLPEPYRGTARKLVGNLKEALLTKSLKSCRSEAAFLRNWLMDLNVFDWQTRDKLGL